MNAEARDATAMSTALRSAVSPIVTHFRGFDPHSRTLRGPNFCSGACLGPDFPEGRTLLWADPAATLHSGDVALIEMEDEAGRWGVGKVIERTRDGRLWGLCETGALPLDELPVIAIAPVVARVVFPWRLYESLPDDPPSADDLAELRELSRPAAREWLRRGFPPRIAIELQNAR